jgi:pyruvate dehydrogenase E2 component (dihydrolipoamide acetyltransferase)
MTEGTLTEWLKRPGDPVSAGEVLFLFESEKATMEYEAPADGVMGELLVAAGATVPCGAAVATLHDRAEAVNGVGVIAAAAPAPAQRPASLPLSLPPATVLATPAAKRRARELGVALADLSGRGPNGRVQAADVEAAAGRSQQPFETLRLSERAVTPIARKLAADLGIDLDRVQASGPEGRIERADVLATARRLLSEGTASALAPRPPAASERPTYASRTPLAGVRAVIARRMSESAFTAPHVTLFSEADATALVAARQQINDELAGAAKISYNALLVALVARALRQHPSLNACLVEGEIRVYEAVNIALAVDTERGLVAPVIRDADRLHLLAIQQLGDELIARALAGTSLPDDFSGGSFTITNLGGFDIDGFTPIINQPQAAILGVGRIASRPVDVGGVVGLRQMMTLSLSFDHRLVDGGPAARFLQRLKQLIERPFAWAIASIVP